MITDEDTNKIVNRIIKANHELFYTKPEMDGKFEELRTDFSKLQSSVDSFSVGTKKNEEEVLISNNRIDGQEDWIKRAAPKVGLEFKP